MAGGKEASWENVPLWCARGFVLNTKRSMLHHLVTQWLWKEACELTNNHLTADSRPGDSSILLVGQVDTDTDGSLVPRMGVKCVELSEEGQL